MPADAAEKLPHLSELNAVDSKGHDQAWFVYHRDMKKNAKVQALYSFLKEKLGDS